MTVDPRLSSSTTPRSPGPRLTERTLAHHQRDMTRFHNEPGVAGAARRAAGESTIISAKSIGFGLSEAAATRFDGMTSLERFKAEKQHGLDAWSPFTSRR